MQAVEVPVFEGTTVARRITRAEYDRLVKEGFFGEDERLELIHGIVVRMSPIGFEHCDLVDELNLRLVRRLGDRARIRIQNPTIADDESEPQPDIAVVPLGRYSKQHPERAYLVIEVADSSLIYDRKTKGPLYAASGVPEYWIVDVKGRAIEVYTSPKDGHYTSMERFDRAGSVSPKAFPDFTLDVAELFTET